MTFYWWQPIKTPSCYFKTDSTSCNPFSFPLFFLVSSSPFLCLSLLFFDSLFLSFPYSSSLILPLSITSTFYLSIYYHLPLHPLTPPICLPFTQINQPEIFKSPRHLNIYLEARWVSGIASKSTKDIFSINLDLNPWPLLEALFHSHTAVYDTNISRPR